MALFGSNLDLIKALNGDGYEGVKHYVNNGYEKEGRQIFLMLRII